MKKPGMLMGVSGPARDAPTGPRSAAGTGAPSVVVGRSAGRPGACLRRTEAGFRRCSLSPALAFGRRFRRDVRSTPSSVSGEVGRSLEDAGSDAAGAGVVVTF